MRFDAFNPPLDPRLLEAIAQVGLEEATEVQSESFGPFVAGEDLTATASTGTGKTYAFLIPLAQRLLQPARGAGPGPRAVILSPTRDLGCGLGDLRLRRINNDRADLAK